MLLWNIKQMYKPLDLLFRLTGFRHTENRGEKKKAPIVINYCDFCQTHRLSLSFAGEKGDFNLNNNIHVCMACGIVEPE